MKAHDIAIIGGGWAGMAAAVTLAQAGKKVTVYEAARSLGGRARRLTLASKHDATGSHSDKSGRSSGHLNKPIADEWTLDNGQHILLGAYQETLKLFDQIGINQKQAFLRIPLQLVYPDGWQFSAARLPHPLHTLLGLVCAKGMTIRDKLSLAKILQKTQKQNWQLPQTMSTVADWLINQPKTLCQRIWIPLCLAALNTPVSKACGQVFLHILRDTLSTTQSHSNILLPKKNLSALFPDVAATYVKKNGGEVKLGHHVKHIDHHANQWQLTLRTQEKNLRHQAVILATSPSTSLNFLKTISLQQPKLAQTIQALSEMTYESIFTVYLAYPGIRLAKPFYALESTPQAPGQFVFDRGYLQAQHRGILAIVISAPDQHITQLSHAALAQQLHQQLQQAFHLEKTYAWYRVIHEKQATLSSHTSRPKLSESVLLNSPSLLIAGDFITPNNSTLYPATLESAVRSGIAAAQALITSRGAP